MLRLLKCCSWEREILGNSDEKCNSIRKYYSMRLCWVIWIYSSCFLLTKCEYVFCKNIFKKSTRPHGIFLLPPIIIKLGYLFTRPNRPYRVLHSSLNGLVAMFSCSSRSTCRAAEGLRGPQRGTFPGASMTSWNVPRGTDDRLYQMSYCVSIPMIFVSAIFAMLSRQMTRATLTAKMALTAKMRDCSRFTAWIKLTAKMAANACS